MKKIYVLISVISLLGVLGYTQHRQDMAISCVECYGSMMAQDTIKPNKNCESICPDSLAHNKQAVMSGILDEVRIKECGKKPLGIRKSFKVQKGSGKSCKDLSNLEQRAVQKTKYYYIDGVRVSGSADPDATNSCISITGGTEILEKEELIAGQLSASEWNDLRYWSEWEELTKDGIYTSMLYYWQLPMGKREAVFVTNKNLVPIPNVSVHLLDHEGRIVWQAMTDHKGTAELWHPISGESGVSIMAEHEGSQSSVTLEQINGQKRKGNYITLEETCPSYAGLDIMFVVDATGSMEDEINYLKAELADVISNVSNHNNMSLRTGTVFYKDKWDDYLYAVSDLDNDINKTLDFMSEQSIGGGGDYPEAMDVALGHALQQDWDKEALNRIIFLLLDAPPHDDPEVIDRIDEQVRAAAANGIKLIPITASGIDRETEYLMKQMAMMTNGTYVFLTDDSGIGDTHLVHAIPDYDVEQLNELLVRLISSYGEAFSCEVNSQVNTNTQLQEQSIEVKVFPNPAITNVTVELSEVVDKVILHSSSGKILKQVDANGRKQIEMEVSDLTAGMYTVSVMLNGISVDRKSLVVIN